MRIDILTVLPQMFTGPFTESIIKRAGEKGLVSINVHDIRAFSTDRHHTTDDYPYGGGPGMVMKPDPIFAAVEAVLTTGRAAIADCQQASPPIILLSPSGRLFNQQVAQDLSLESWLVLICGHYEGVDERVRQNLVTDEISVGDYILTGGEIPAMVVTDAVVRLLPGVLAPDSAADESFTHGLLEYPQYTRPPEFRGWSVPDILLSGHHAEVAKWRRLQSLRHSLEKRPDLLESAPLTGEERRLVEEWLEGTRLGNG
ncbi:MAG: tRNA (guanosine(37)-N1)-methyltransferase TrmD [Dehalococcoidia bacterium]|nr:tRNA (guanosine(37)-N1)-methyltransferase TrmD [Dehalococcoidia bacterium]